MLVHWIANAWVQSTSVISRSVPKSAFSCSPVAQAQNLWHRLKVTAFSSEAFCWRWFPWMTQCHDMTHNLGTLETNISLSGNQQYWRWSCLPETPLTKWVFQSIPCGILVSVLGRHCVSVAGSSSQQLLDLSQVPSSGFKCQKKKDVAKLSCYLSCCFWGRQGHTPTGICN